MEAEQAELEQRVQVLGQSRGDRNIAKALERGKAGETPAGVRCALAGGAGG